MSSIQSNMYALTPAELGRAVEIKKKKDFKNAQEGLPGVLTGLAAGGTAIATLNHMEKQATSIPIKSSVVNDMISEVAKHTKNVFNPEVLKNAAKNPVTPVLAIGLGTAALVTGASKMVKDQAYSLFGTAVEAKKIRDNRKVDTKA